MRKFEKSSHPAFQEYCPRFQQDLENLYRLTVYSRWVVVVLLWAILGSLSIWRLWPEIYLWSEYFTWTAVRYGLAFHPLAALGLTICVATTVGVLVWQSRTILFGLSDDQTQRLEKQLLKIRQQGPSHPLWKWVYKN
jgi:hypothetical protein